jgi:hypothetical protein
MRGTFQASSVFAEVSEMQSPFPGMDPYIEKCGFWKDFHDDLIAEFKRAIVPVLPPKYVVRTGARSYIALVESEEKDERHFEPDVRVTEPRGRKPNHAKEPKESATAVAHQTDAMTLRAFIEEDFEEQFIDIYELEPERRLVTSIEVLSPSNKKRNSPGWKKYLRKRQALLLGKANLVEIDLLRGGTRMPMLDPFPDSPYYILVAREEKAPWCRVWPTYFDKPLPTIPVPLSKPDPDIPLALQPFVDAIYQRSRYFADIDYSRTLKPPLTPEQTAWLARQLRGGTKAAKPKARQPRRRRR